METIYHFNKGHEINVACNTSKSLCSRVREEEESIILIICKVLIDANLFSETLQDTKLTEIDVNVGKT
jgi:hypothetical protein